MATADDPALGVGFAVSVFVIPLHSTYLVHAQEDPLRTVKAIVWHDVAPKSNSVPSICLVRGTTARACHRYFQTSMSMRLGYSLDIFFLLRMGLRYQRPWSLL